MSNQTPSPWIDVPPGTTLCSRHYEQALTANRAHSVVRPSSAPANDNNSGGSAGPPLNDGRRTALSDGHRSGANGEGGGISGGRGQLASDSPQQGAEESAAAGNDAATDSPRGDVGQVVEGEQSRPGHNAEASGGLRQNAAAGFFPGF